MATPQPMMCLSVVKNSIKERVKDIGVRAMMLKMLDDLDHHKNELGLAKNNIHDWLMEQSRIVECSDTWTDMDKYSVEECFSRIEELMYAEEEYDDQPSAAKDEGNDHADIFSDDDTSTTDGIMTWIYNDLHALADHVRYIDRKTATASCLSLVAFAASIYAVLSTKMYMHSLV